MQNAQSKQYQLEIVNCALWIVHYLEFSHYEFDEVVAVGKDEEGKE